MARHIFGGTTDFAAEDQDGNRLPGKSGTVWDGPGDSAQQVTDMTDMDGNAITVLTADQNGMVPAFKGPDGATELWVDFGPGKYGVVPSDSSELLQEHVTGDDPHGDRSYTDQQLQHYVRRDQSNAIDVAAVDGWLKPTLGGTRTALILATDQAGDCSWRVQQDGYMYIKAKAGADGIRSTVDNGRGAFIVRSRDTDKDTVTIQGDGTASFAGPVNAPNIGNTRIYSGPKPPDNPQVGDVWIQYG
ncbi:hypothetical protein [Streptomyces sp. 769]|uniref:hypothetical protein n=1 Tax=Streptomyces sp. 769 TaxID=1262452 RepID=UPI000581CFB9|nr:hypothetical protein [Streptomyces sp. 769]AJC54005.1 hypothetical protein GZL_01405 [Streptomyces sp. 769]